MINIKTIPVGPIATNCYVVHDDAGQAFVIDPGCEFEPILEALKGLSVRRILLTHAHYDHIGGVEAVKEATAAPVAIHQAEASWLTDPELNFSGASSFAPRPIDGPPADELLHDGDRLELLGETIEVIHTPGHSPGHVAYRMGDILFGGDLLFSGGVGRTDLPGGSFDELMESLRRILTLPDNTQVLPGHGPSTTIGRERQTNPFLGG